MALFQKVICMWLSSKRRGTLFLCLTMNIFVCERDCLPRLVQSLRRLCNCSQHAYAGTRCTPPLPDPDPSTDSRLLGRGKMQPKNPPCQLYTSVTSRVRMEPSSHLHVTAETGKEQSGQTYRCTFIHTYIQIYITYIHTYIHTQRIHTYICTYIRTYIHTYILVYIHASRVETTETRL